MEQELVVGARVVHAQYGEGVIVDVKAYNRPYLVKFDSNHSDLHNGGDLKYPDKYMLWISAPQLAVQIPSVAPELTCGTILNTPTNFLKEKQ